MHLDIEVYHIVDVLQLGYVGLYRPLLLGVVTLLGHLRAL